MNPADILLDQILTLAWIRCAMEEGVNFISKKTKQREQSERAILLDWQNSTGEFDVPKANCSPSGVAKNVLEVVGGYIAYEWDEDITAVITSLPFRHKLKQKLAGLSA